VGLGAVEVGEAVFAGEGPGAEDAAGPFHGARIGGEGDDGAADVAGRFGGEEILRRVVLVGGVYVGVLALAGVLPVGFGDAEMVEDGFGAEEAGSERDGDDVETRGQEAVKKLRFEISPESAFKDFSFRRPLSHV
jgi:hypothetical protein